MTAVTTYPTVLDAGTASVLRVVNTGDRVLRLWPAGGRVAPGGSVTLEGTRGVPLTATVETGTGSADVVVLASFPDIDGSSPDPGDSNGIPAGSVTLSDLAQEVLDELGGGGGGGFPGTPAEEFRVTVLTDPETGEVTVSPGDADLIETAIGGPAAGRYVYLVPPGEDFDPRTAKVEVETFWDFGQTPNTLVFDSAPSVNVAGWTMISLAVSPRTVRSLQTEVAAGSQAARRVFARNDSVSGGDLVAPFLGEFAAVPGDLPVNGFARHIVYTGSPAVTCTLAPIDLMWEWVNATQPRAYSLEGDSITFVNLGEDTLTIQAWPGGEVNYPDGPVESAAESIMGSAAIDVAAGASVTLRTFYYLRDQWAITGTYGAVTPVT